MSKQNSKVTIHMVSSLDGFIANEKNTIDWMHSKDTYEPGITLTEEYIQSFIQSIDCYVMGSKTYEHALNLGWPYGETPVTVVSARTWKRRRESVSFYKGDLAELVSKLKERHSNIWMVGGAALTKSFISAELVDEIVVSIVPVILGGGLLFFDFIGKVVPLHLKNTQAFKDGMVELTYEVVNRLP